MADIEAPCTCLPPHQDLELRIVAKNLASKTLKEVGNDLKKFTSSTTSSMGILIPPYGDGV